MEDVISRVVSKGRELLGQLAGAPAKLRSQNHGATPAGAVKSGLLGATVTEKGVHFGVFSSQAEAIDLCLYEAAQPAREVLRVRMECDEMDVWEALVPSAKPGMLYGYRVHGPWQPERGLFCNPHKLLVDPYAKAIHGSTSWQPGMQSSVPDGSLCFFDNGEEGMKAVIVGGAFDWEDDALLHTPWHRTVLYEMHVKGFTAAHPGIPEKLRGTYAGLAHPEAVRYLKELGVSAVQLLPVHQHLDDAFLLEKGLTNYWGYNTANFFAPHSEYAAAKAPEDQVAEFKAMVRELHRAGIEVILDVVYNHTAEGAENGPSISYRGLDNRAYYMMNSDLRTVNYTGCGNTVNAASPAALKLILDSMRYWAEHMHVDGFRFDLATTMGRRGEYFDGAAPFFQAVAQDPILSRIKLIAEPWDIGPHGYQVGAFPRPWRELNGRYRDRVRRFWRGDDGMAASVAKRLCGSQEIYGPAGRPTHASINMLTSHDGFTLRDLWSYDQKHNEANGEDNRDGDNHNHGWNGGVEGETDDRVVITARRKLVRACLATMFCSLGVPFITMGDERWRTQQGNNNAYCQDNPLSWLDWLSFSGQKLTLDDISTVLAGGKIKVSGSVDLTKISDPAFNIRLDANQALLVRDNTMSCRADAGVTCVGKLTKADIAGRVELVRGRVFKEIEFLPLSLPQNLPPPPPPVKRSGGPPSLPPPFSNWTINVDILTRDEIRLLGNVLNGGTVVKLHAGGTGAKPELVGKVTLDGAGVRLPYSRLAFSRGDIVFTQEKPLDPQLDLQGDSLVNGYEVTLNVTGSAYSPQIRFSSSPSLSDGDIASLLATGSTGGDLQSSEGAAANGAAFLVISRLYHSLFNKASPKRYNDEPPKLSFSFSPLDTGTSGRSVSARYEISPKLQATGTIADNGQFRGLLYYLIRFR